LPPRLPEFLDQGVVRGAHGSSLFVRLVRPRLLAYRPRGFGVRGNVAMKILVVQGAGMNMRGKTQTEIFGTMTLDQYNEHIRQYAAELGVEVEIFHSNTEGQVIDRLYAASDQGFVAALFNPAGFSRGYPALTAAISQVTFPVIEVHISNPVRRGPVSDTAAVSLGMVAGFGVLGYYLAMRGLRDTRKG
jgi:3-dehydroquinate dehydratase II